MNNDHQPSLQEWKALYGAALEFKELAPWDWMHDCDIFGVKDPENGETGSPANKNPGLEVQGSKCMAIVQESYSRVRSMVSGGRAGKVTYDCFAAGNRGFNAV